MPQCLKHTILLINSTSPSTLNSNTIRGSDYIYKRGTLSFISTGTFSLANKLKM